MLFPMLNISPPTTTDQPFSPISPAALEHLMSTLDVQFVALAQCLVSEGYCLKMRGLNATGIHYNLEGNGKIIFENNKPIDLTPHTLIVAPPNCPYQIWVENGSKDFSSLIRVNGSDQTAVFDSVRQFVAGQSAQPDINLICGYFVASYGASVNLFENLTSVIVEQFQIDDQIDQVLKNALKELTEKKAGSNAMSAVLLKQVIIALLRRSLGSIPLWIQRFSILTDPRIAKVFAEMVADPGAPYTVQGLAGKANLSRSAFMVKFTELIGRSPMAVLRDLRMHQAAQQLKASEESITQIAQTNGYSSRSSFNKAFKLSFGSYPSDFRRSFKADLNDR